MLVFIPVQLFGVDYGVMNIKGVATFQKTPIFNANKSTSTAISVWVSSSNYSTTSGILNSTNTWTQPQVISSVTITNATINTGIITNATINTGTISNLILPTGAVITSSFTNITIFPTNDIVGANNGNWVTTKGWTANKDDLGEYDSATSTITLHFSGNYNIFVNISLDPNANGDWCRVRLMVDHNHVGGSRYSEFSVNSFNTSTSYNNLSRALNYDLSAGDKIWLDMWTDSGGNMTIKGGNTIDSCITVNRIK